jgi:membrane fusion protein (multidrug efflux system)
MSQIKLNQKVKFSIDAFPGVNFTGNLFSIGTNTASQFSLIPPNNASGNFTKVTQRIPVKLSISSCDKGTLSSYNLLTGMSVITKIYKQ